MLNLHSGLEQISSQTICKGCTASSGAQWNSSHFTGKLHLAFEFFTQRLDSFGCSLSQTGSTYKDNEVRLKRGSKAIQWLESRTYVLQNKGATVHMWTLATRFCVKAKKKTHVIISGAPRGGGGGGGGGGRERLFSPSLYLSLPPIMQPIHHVHNGPPAWMNAAVLFMTQYPLREGKTEQRGEKCRTQVTISAPASEVVLLSGPFLFFFSFFTLSECLRRCLFFFSPFFFHCPPRVCFPLVRSAEWDSAFPLETGPQPVAVCVCCSRERKQPRATWEQLLTNWWNRDFNWEWKRHRCNLLSAPQEKPAGVAFSRCRELSPKPCYTLVIGGWRWTSAVAFQPRSV